MTVVRLGSLERIDIAGVHWLPLRRALGVTAFKTNAYVADAGERLIEAHDESASGQEEMYILVSGRATFEVDGGPVEVSAGSVVFYSDPGSRRGAVAQADGTLAVARPARPAPFRRGSTGSRVRPGPMPETRKVRMRPRQLA